MPNDPRREKGRTERTTGTPERESERTGGGTPGQGQEKKTGTGGGREQGARPRTPGKQEEEEFGRQGRESVNPGQTQPRREERGTGQN